MRQQVLTMCAFAAALALGACGRPAQQSDQPGTPAEPASAPAEPAALTDAQKTAILATLPAAYQTADIDNGQSRFALCKSCHTTAEGGPDTTGPNLHGVFGRKAGTKPGYHYSDAVKASGIVWSADTINTWIENPKKDVPGTKMTYVGMNDAKARTDLIAYLAIATATPPK
jgi:cytochrome c